MGHAPVLSPHFGNVAFYIDCFNLYYSLLEFCNNWTIVNGKKYKHKKECNIFECKASQYKWCNLRLLCERIAINHGFKEKCNIDVNLFTSSPSKDSLNYYRHIAFEKIQSFYGSKIIKGRFSKYKEEKETDVNIVIKMIEDILFNNIKTVFLVTNDSDFVPLIDFLKRMASDTKLFLYTPPNRSTVYHLKESICRYYGIDTGKLGKKKIDNRNAGIYSLSPKLMLRCKIDNEVDIGNEEIIGNPYKKN